MDSYEIPDNRLPNLYQLFVCLTIRRLLRLFEQLLKKLIFSAKVDYTWKNKQQNMGVQLRILGNYFEKAQLEINHTPPNILSIHSEWNFLANSYEKIENLCKWIFNFGSFKQPTQQFGSVVFLMHLPMVFMLKTDKNGLFYFKTLIGSIFMLWTRLNENFFLKKTVRRTVLTLTISIDCVSSSGSSISPIMSGLQLTKHRARQHKIHRLVSYSSIIRAHIRQN